MLPTRSLVSALSLALAAGCTCNVGEMAAGRGEALAAVEEFHARMNDGRSGEIYDGASDEFRGASKRQRFDGLLSAVERKLGKVTETKNVGWRVNSRNFQTYVELSQETRFERGEARESFVFLVRGGKASLLRYHIESDDLIMR